MMALRNDSFRFLFLACRGEVPARYRVWVSAMSNSTITQGVLGSPVGSVIVRSMSGIEIGWIRTVRIHGLYAATGSLKKEGHLDAIWYAVYSTS